MGRVLSAGRVSTRQRAQRHVLSVQLDSQTRIRSLVRHVSFAWLASMLRVDTAVTALAAQVVASHQLVVAQR